MLDETEEQRRNDDEYHLFYKQETRFLRNVSNQIYLGKRDIVYAEHYFALTNYLQVSSDSFITVAEAEEEGIEAPKVLGDIFESVAGAVFLDSGMDLKETWRVCYRMMAPYIEKYSKNVPRNPIRLVHESDAKADFGKVETLKDGRVKCKLRVSWGEFEGYGANGRIAKLAAAKFAMEYKKRKHDR